MNRQFFLFLSLGLTLFLSACGGEKSATEVESKGRIGMTCMDLTNPFFKLIANIMTEEGAKHGYTVTALSGELDPAKQNSQLTDFVAQGYDAIFLNPVDSRSAGQGVKAAHEAGIPVFTFDIQVSDEAAAEMVVSHIGSDNFQGGQLAGESMIKAIGNEGKVAVLSLPEVTSCILRVDGFKDSLAKANSPIEIVTELNGKGSRDAGYTVATDILQAHPDITGIFAINDPSALGAHAAVTKAGKDEQITIVAFDASPAGKQGVFEKKLYDTPQQFPRKMAEGTVQSFVDYLAGKDVEKKVLIPCSHYLYETSVTDESRINEQW
jgi:ribose transport system substrate-binding protein